MNLLGIQAASSIVLWMNGFHQIIAPATKRQTSVVRNMISPLIIAALAVSLSASFYKRWRATVREQRARPFDRALVAYPGVYLSDLRFECADEISPENTRDLRGDVRPTRSAPIKSSFCKIDSAENRHGQPIELHVRSVLTSETSRLKVMFISCPRRESKASAAKEANGRCPTEPNRSKQKSKRKQATI